jgi:acetyl esterase/lipase
MSRQMIEVRSATVRHPHRRRVSIVVCSLLICGAAVVSFIRSGDEATAAAVVPPTTVLATTTTVPATTTTVPVTTTTLPAPSLLAAAALTQAVPRQVLAELPAAESLVRIPDIAYGPLPEQSLDMMRSSGPRLHPGAIVYVHGGAWAGGDKDIRATPFQDVLDHLITEEGWTVFSINYRVNTPFPDALLDVNRAVRWVRAHSYEFGIDPEQVVVYGHSAGAHLAAMLGTTWNEPTLQPTDLPAPLGQVSPRPNGVVSLSGPLDPKAWGDSNPNPADNFSGGHVIAAFAGCMGDWYTSCSAEQLAAIDPSSYVDPADPAIYVGHGDLDGVVYAAAQQAVVLRLQAVLGPDSVWYDLATVGAESDRNHVADGALNVAALRAFLAVVA